MTHCTHAETNDTTHNHLNFEDNVDDVQTSFRGGGDPSIKMTKDPGDPCEAICSRSTCNMHAR